MNRQIEFRGKRLDNNKWVYGYLYIHEAYLLDQHTKYYIAKIALNDCNLADLIEVDPETIGQFTGQLDKDNKKIFENDFVKYPKGWSGDYQMASSYSLVYWEDCSSSFMIEKPEDVNYDECEVIGNKFDGVKKC